MLTLASPIKEFVNIKTHRYASCWRITREDGTILRFTDHCGALTIDTGEQFLAADGMTSSAREHPVGLAPGNAQHVGIISSSALDDDDLRAGLYDEARIDELLVDWRIPWMGAILQETYWIDEVSWDGQRWAAQVSGISRFLREQVGEAVDRTCTHDLGDQFRGEVTIGCPVDTDAITQSLTVTSIDVARQQFQSNSAEADGYFQLGHITWTSGANNGLVSEVQQSLLSNGTFYLVLPTPYAIAVNDTFDARPGCGKIPEHCKGTSGNGGKPWTTAILSYNGEPFVPGMDRMLRSPGA